MPEPITADALEGQFGSRRLMEQLAFILEVEKLKTILRKTPLLDRSRVENDAEHTWQLALMAMVLSEHSREPVDLLRVIKMLLIHDIVEIDAGDTFAYDHVARVSQAERELKAADRIFAILPQDQAAEFRALWDEFELKATAESRFANAMDRLQPTLHNFFTEGGTWNTKGVTSADVQRRTAPIAVSSDSLGELCKQLVASAIEQGILAPAPDDQSTHHTQSN
ncbi:HD domain-containing protein [Neorhizobium sp. JUb45]|uniref:HD domain-containing protein n=1 Tax=Neorhizobium sp. JUb45 TaxID=2485113 RepID=UPI00104326D1|nr:HD domain-containing protein [Neorhizobium sp. JUb45]TCQ97271.1 putative hydrolase of HD superfamily [Neorhizobium sp. JUb45]